MTATDSSKIEEIDAELDKRALRALKLMNELITAKLDLEQAVKAGSLDLAKARYIMGNRNVSALQLPTPGEGTEVVPLVTVQRADTFQDSSNDSQMENVISLQLERVSISDESGRNRSTHSLKKRTTDKHEEQNPLLGGDDDEEEEEQQQEEKVGNGSPSVQDPIKWFGVLVPQNLRQGQVRFRKALELVVHAANIQLELHATVAQFKQLLDTKRNIASSELKPDIDQSLVT